MSPPRLRLGTRSSPLARWQSEWVAARLKETGAEVEMINITTQGDVKSGPLGQIGGTGLFTKELQRALAAGQIDLAVHSLKDLPTDPAPGLVLAAVPERESTADVLVASRFGSLESLPRGARVGTGSLRRRAQLLHVRPDLLIEDIRGNVETRVHKLDEGAFDAIVLAEAGLKRLSLADRITQVLPQSMMLPAVGQGALAIETRADDQVTRRAVRALDHDHTHQAVLAERTLLATLRAGCLAPVGALGWIDGDRLNLQAVVLSADGAQRLTAGAATLTNDAVYLGQIVAEELIGMGAAELIAAAHSKP